MPCLSPFRNLGRSPVANAVGLTPMVTAQHGDRCGINVARRTTSVEHVGAHQSAAHPPITSSLGVTEDEACLSHELVHLVRN